MTTALPFTKASLRRRIEALLEAGLTVKGIDANGTVLVLVPEEISSPGATVHAEASEWEAKP